MAREIVHRLQTMRKSAGFEEIADYITTYYQGDDYVKQVMADFADYVKQETLSRILIDGKPEEGAYSETFKLLIDTAGGKEGLGNAFTKCFSRAVGDLNLSFSGFQPTLEWKFVRRVV